MLLLRAASLASTASFSSRVAPDQQAISSIVRKQPSHQPVRASILHTLMQGEGTS